MKNDMTFKFYGQQVEAILIDGDRERRDEWFVKVNGQTIGRIYDSYQVDETEIMRFVENWILENLENTCGYSA